MLKINFASLNNPQNLWGKWLKLSAPKQIASLIFMMMLGLYLPMFSLFTQYQSLSQMKNLVVETQTQLEHKQQLINSLKQKSEQRLLTPQLARQLMPINQHIEQLQSELEMELSQNQWIFNSNPQLALQIQSRFQDLRLFLTTLLAKQPKLRLISINIQQIEQSDYSIETDLLLQLTQENQ